MNWSCAIAGFSLFAMFAFILWVAYFLEDRAGPLERWSAYGFAILLLAIGIVLAIGLLYSPEVRF